MLRRPDAEGGGACGTAPPKNDLKLAGSIEAENRRSRTAWQAGTNIATFPRRQSLSKSAARPVPVVRLCPSAVPMGWAIVADDPDIGIVICGLPYRHRETAEQQAIGFP